MMKLFSSSSHAKSYFQSIQRQLFSSISTQTRYPPKGSGPDSLYRRISALGDPKLSALPVLDQWIKQGNEVSKTELQHVIKELNFYNRAKQALEVSQWMTDKRYFPLDHSDVDVRINLIYKVHGLEKAESCYNNIPKKLKRAATLSLLNCYVSARSVEKAEALMQKARDSGFAIMPIWYSIMMNLHHHLGNWEKLDDLMNEMEAKGIKNNKFTLGIRLKAYAAASDRDGVDKIVRKLESDPSIVHDSISYIVAAEGYLKVGLNDKALEMLHKAEKCLKNMKRKNHVYTLLFSLYAEAGKKDELYRIWNSYKEKSQPPTHVYVTMMDSLLKVDDFEGVERIFKQWELSGLRYHFEVANFLVDVYCRNGLMEKVELLIQSVIDKGGVPNVRTWKHLAGGYVTQNCISKAAEALRKGILIDPSDDTMTACLEYLENGEDTKNLAGLVRADGISSAAVIDKLFLLTKDVKSQVGEQDMVEDNVSG